MVMKEEGEEAEPVYHAFSHCEPLDTGHKVLFEFKHRWGYFFVDTVDAVFMAIQVMGGLLMFFAYDEKDDVGPVFATGFSSGFFGLFLMAYRSFYTEPFRSGDQIIEASEDDDAKSDASGGAPPRPDADVEMTDLSAAVDVGDASSGDSVAGGPAAASDADDAGAASDADDVNAENARGNDADAAAEDADDASERDDAETCSTASGDAEVPRDLEDAKPRRRAKRGDLS